jgi:hypothetical protein
MKRLTTILAVTLSAAAAAQNWFPYEVSLQPVTFTGLPGLHSFAHGQYQGEWVLVGGRTDGIHARQPFASFPAAQNNSNVYVVNPSSGQVWSAPLTTLSVSLQEQLRSTNPNYAQHGDSLYVLGGYGYSATAGAHKTYNGLVAISLPALISAVKGGTSLAPAIEVVNHPRFAVTGGHLALLGDRFYLVGGHRFDGSYNPHGPTHGPGFSQAYTNAVRSFEVRRPGGQLQVVNVDSVVDPVHLHRRDYNLMPQIYANGTPGFMISSGVFQPTIDLPFLYPVEVTATGIAPRTDFSQYLSHYHSASTVLFDSATERNLNLFFGGISQYHYANGTLIDDQNVPFVSTISAVVRDSDQSLHEVVLPVSMPGLKGASAEFLRNLDVAHTPHEVQLLPASFDSLVLGHIVGGIDSQLENAFTNNSTGSTSATPTVYRVVLKPGNGIGVEEVPATQPFTFSVLGRGTNAAIQLPLGRPETGLDLWMYDPAGRILWSQTLYDLPSDGRIALPRPTRGTVFVVASWDGLYHSEKVEL